MTNTEAMKQALEALEAFLRFAAIHHDGPDTSDKYLAEDYAVEGFRKARQVLPALRTAIAEAEKQEPVAEVKLKTTGGNVGIATVIHEIYSHYREPLRVGDKLYTTPPAAQRTWVGLTEEEVKHEWEVWRASVPRYAGFAKGIEAKLKEKNT